MKLKIKSLNSGLLGLLKKFFGHIIISVMIIISIWIIYFMYDNVYTSTINPKPISENEIIARKQKIEIDLFQEINNSIQNKKTTDDRLGNINNPF